MTFGIGLNVENSDAAAVVYQVNPAWDFNTLQLQTGQPVPPMTSQEVIDMLYYTLIGVQNQAGKFQGEIPVLIKRLGDELANQTFEINQLVTLVSLAFNNPALIGDSLKSALQLQETLPVLIEIIEQSNKDLSIGIANRRLKEGGFYNNPQDIYLTWREYGKLCMDSEFNNRPPNYFSRHALPMGNDQNTYTGGATIQTMEGRDKKGLDTVTYGSDATDSILIDNVGENYLDSGHKVIFGGSGDDLIQVSSADSYKHYHFMAGEEGYDRYDITTKNYHEFYFIVDSDGYGEIVSKNAVLQGIATFNEYDNSYALSSSPYVVNDFLYIIYPTTDFLAYQLFNGETACAAIVDGNAAGNLGIGSSEYRKQISIIEDNITAYTSLLLKTDEILFVYKSKAIILDFFKQSGIKTNTITHSK